MSSTTIYVTPEKAGIFHVEDVSTTAIETANKLLQANHEEWHILWNAERFLHNHQVHYLLTDVALGASAEQVKEAFDNNKDYQLSVDTGDEERLFSIDEGNFSSALGQAPFYRAFLKYFERKIEENGWENILRDYLFARTSRADDLLGRMLEGAIHPIIHLGFGVEFVQPAIIAEALAQGAIHPLEAGELLLRVERLSAKHRDALPGPTFVDLLLEISQDPSIKNADCWKGGSFERNGNFFATLPKNLVKILTKFRIEPSEQAVEERLAEMCNVAAWFTAACQRPNKMVKFDFFYMHCVNFSIFPFVFSKLSWLSIEDKVRLLEWTVRFDLVIYACQGSPELRTEEITNYQPRQMHWNSWPKVIDRSKNISCDGHVVKMIRALNHASIMSAPYETLDENERSFPVKGNMWLKIANMVLDSTEDYSSVLDKWMRGPGFDLAWDVVPDRQ